jgi:hypothetical protein
MSSNLPIIYSKLDNWLSSKKLGYILTEKDYEILNSIKSEICDLIYENKNNTFFEEDYDEEAINYQISEEGLRRLKNKLKEDNKVIIPKINKNND